MFSDSAILLRGPKYYAGVDGEAGVDALASYLKAHIDFCARATQAVTAKAPNSATLLDIKLVAASLDNIRSSLLYSICAAYELPAFFDVEFDTAGLIRSAMRVLECLVDLLWEGHLFWTSQFREVGEVAQEAGATLSSFLDSVLTLLDQVPKVRVGQGAALPPASPRPDRADGVDEEGKPRLLAWRECDSISENFLAVSIALSEFTTRGRIRESGFSAVGVLNGGVELPLVASVIAKRRGLRCEPVFVKKSIYGDNQKGAAPPAFWPHDPDPDSDCVLFDDNCTTGRTLQSVQDYCIERGYRLAGAVIVRFPGANRIQQNTRLFSRPSPTGEKVQYKDSKGDFDKAKRRVKHLISKRLYGVHIALARFLAMSRTMAAWTQATAVLARSS